MLEGVVVLATGGYANDHSASSLLRQHVPHLADFPTTNGPWAQGQVHHHVATECVRDASQGSRKRQVILKKKKRGSWHDAS